MRLYYHKTDGGAEYLCSENVPGTDEGAFPSRYVLSTDLESDVQKMVAAEDMYNALQVAASMLDEIAATEGMLWYREGGTLATLDEVRAALREAEREVSF